MKVNAKDVAKNIAAEGIVLLKNENNNLPIQEEKIALFGVAQFNHIKSNDGTRMPEYTVGIAEAFQMEGIQLDRELAETYAEWNRTTKETLYSSSNLRLSGPIEMPLTEDTVKEVKKRGARKAVIAISRISYENIDMTIEKGDYLLSDSEYAMIKNVCSVFDKVILMLNLGGMIDLGFLDECKIDGILYLNLSGENGAVSAARIIKGDINPSGKMTFSVAKHYEDYPSSGNFGQHGGGILQDYYEDIYVGYRYFDNFKGKDQNLLFPFGYGLSYTTFETDKVEYEEREGRIHISARVTNTGACAGKQVLQVYYGAPTAEDGAILCAPPRQLCGFQKTGLLEPGMSETLTFYLMIDDMASYDDLGILGEKSCFVMEQGEYKLWVATHSRDLKLAGIHKETEHRVVRRCHSLITTLSKRLNGYGEYDVLPQPPYDENRYHAISAMIKTSLETSFAGLKKGDTVTHRLLPGTGGAYYVRFCDGDKVVDIQNLLDVAVQGNPVYDLHIQSDGTTEIVLPPARCLLSLTVKKDVPDITHIVFEKKDTKEEVYLDRVNVISASSVYEASFGIILKTVGKTCLTNFFRVGFQVVFQLDVMQEADYDIAFEYMNMGETMSMASAMSVAISNIVQPLGAGELKHTDTLQVSDKSTIHLPKGIVYLKIVMEKACDLAISEIILTKCEERISVAEGRQVENVVFKPRIPKVLGDFSHVEKIGIQLSDVYRNRELMKAFLEQLSNRELATIVSGTSLNNTESGDVGCNHPLPARGVPAGQSADGPCGLRQFGYSPTAFPVGNVLAATWNRELHEAYGRAIAAEAKYYKVDYWLGPGINILRNPTGGRNFSYYSEDPYLSAITASGVIQSLQEQGVAAVLKHYAANSTEYERVKSNSRVSERAIREIYIKTFEIAVKKCNPMAIMSSYNHLNDVKICEDYKMITEIPRDEWGWEGVFFTDWGNLSSHVYELKAGHDLKMEIGEIDSVTEALDSGELERGQVERSAERILNMLMKIERIQKLLQEA